MPGAQLGVSPTFDHDGAEDYVDVRPEVFKVPHLFELTITLKYHRTNADKMQAFRLMRVLRLWLPKLLAWVFAIVAEKIGGCGCSGSG